MVTIVDDPSIQIARRIRLEREIRAWSLADLAAKSGVSKAMISKVERGEVSPSAGTLVRLASAFDLTLAGLLIRAEGDGNRLTRAGDQSVWRDPESGYVRTQVFRRSDHPVEIVKVVLPAGSRVTMPASSYAHIRQVVWVQSGNLVIEETGGRHHLSPGDCLAFGAPCDVTFANETAEPCIYVVSLVRN